MMAHCKSCGKEPGENKLLANDGNYYCYECVMDMFPEDEGDEERGNQ